MPGVRKMSRYITEQATRSGTGGGGGGSVIMTADYLLEEYRH